MSRQGGYASQRRHCQRHGYRTVSDRCPASGKRRFHKRAEALLALQECVNRRDMSRPGDIWDVYRCPDCGNWHLTSHGTEADG